MKVIIENGFTNEIEIYHESDYELEFYQEEFLYCRIWENRKEGDLFSGGRVIAYVPKNIDSKLFLGK